MQTHERIEDEEPRLEGGDGLLETSAVGLKIKAQAGAVLTWTSSSARAVPTAAQIPSRRRRTMCGASSAG
jgi:hypothetical protein